MRFISPHKYRITQKGSQLRWHGTQTLANVRDYSKTQMEGWIFYFSSRFGVLSQIRSEDLRPVSTLLLHVADDLVHLALQSTLDHNSGDMSNFLHIYQTDWLDNALIRNGKVVFDAQLKITVGNYHLQAGPKLLLQLSFYCFRDASRIVESTATSLNLRIEP